MHYRMWEPTRMKRILQLDIGFGHVSTIYHSPFLLMYRITIHWMTMDQKMRRRKRTQHILVAGNMSCQGLAMTV
jgi:hypothetical protein